MSKKPHQFWIVFYTDPDVEEGFRYIRYYHEQKIYGWTGRYTDAYRFYRKDHAQRIARQKGGKVDIHPESRYE